MEPLRRLSTGQTFRFACHPQIACFNACCRDLDQFLTPYDILRLKKNLDLPSHQFLSRYTENHLGPRSKLPVVSLKMSSRGTGSTCPFVGPGGCSVYEDRPGSCRSYPLGRVAEKIPGQETCRESFFFIQEPHCLGSAEEQVWTVEAWKRDQCLEPYNQMNDLMLDVLSAQRKRGNKPLTGREGELFFMACYDLDRFRDFVREERLWEETPGNWDRDVVETDDAVLMRLGLAWVKTALLGQDLASQAPASAH